MARPDVLLVSPGSTAGWRAADDELAASMRRAGAHVEVMRAPQQADVRTFALTDLRWALAARAAAQYALAEHDPRSIIYSSTTAALLWPRPGAIRFDSPAAANRPGRHGIWQRPVERRRLAQAPLLVPMDLDGLWEAGEPATPTVVVPIPVEPSGTPVARDVAAVTYATNPRKKGLDVVVAAWEQARLPDEVLIVAGYDGTDFEGVRFAGRMPPDEFRALLRRARVFASAPRREDYGITQLEALADGCRVVTTPSKGPYPARRVVRALDGRFVAEPDELHTALRAALDDDDPAWAQRALEALAPFRRDAVDRVVAEELLPRLLET